MHETLSRWLASNAGDDTLVEHPAVHTIDEALIHVPAMPGLMVKNLFVRDEKGRRHFLVIVPFDKRIDLAALGRLLPASKLSMASPERLLQHLGITPGSVSLFALIHDSAQAVELVLDQAVWEAEFCASASAAQHGHGGAVACRPGQFPRAYGPCAPHRDGAGG